MLDFWVTNLLRVARTASVWEDHVWKPQVVCSWTLCKRFRCAVHQRQAALNLGRMSEQGRRQELTEGVFLLFFPSLPSFLSFLPPFPSPSLHFPWHPYPFPVIPPVPCLSPTSSPPSPLLPSFPVLFPPLPLEVGPLNQLRGLWGHCKVPQQGPGRSPGRNRIYCTLKLLESHW